jgi:hypothetical protein
MPISVPEERIAQYRDGVLHFAHVLECLHIPAVEKAGFKAIPPVSDGSEIIHADIIEKLESSEHVLCDMSCLNPNVFFEWGIRTSLNKPVAVVRDEFVTKVPFDTGILNHRDYESSLDPWDLNVQIERLAEHIKSAFEKSSGKNALWRHFGTKLGSKIEAAPYKSQDLSSDKLELILSHVESLGRQVKGLTEASRKTKENQHPRLKAGLPPKVLAERLYTDLLGDDLEFLVWDEPYESFTAYVNEGVNLSKFRENCDAIYAETGFGISFTPISKDL